MILGLTVLNAVLGLNQEGKAAESVAALQKMLLIKAHVRRGGAAATSRPRSSFPGTSSPSRPATRSRPTDGCCVAATLEIEEAALTGESTPVLKSVEPVAGDDVPLGDRIDMAYMNSTVTRGRGEMVVTATGMETEVGQISGMLGQVQEEKTPLTRQLDQLTVLITIMAAAALALVVVIGLIRGERFDDLFLIGISLAIAAIPTGLPAVVTTMLSLGTQALAAKGAIVKRLRSVETLGSTSAICSDKTGTLTLNQMTARQLDRRRPALLGRRRGLLHRRARSFGSRARRTSRSTRSCCRWRSPTTPRSTTARSSATRPRRRSSSWRRRAVSTSTRRGASIPRVAEVPFDSEYKFMATFHEMEDDGRKVVRCFVKGAPDVLLARSSDARDVDGSRDRDRRLPRACPGRERPARRRGAARARRAPRVTSIRRRFDPDGQLLDEVQELTLLALVGDRRPAAQGGEGRDRAVQGSRDPRAHDHRRPRRRPRARSRTSSASRAALSGTEFAALSDEELDAQVEDIGVVARVAPEDKVRLVETLKQKGHVVAMTGDGVNDAPALKRADIGVAMGITGTEVTKEAGDMILTDDNFATIVTAVEGGRAIYDNLMKYVRFQLITLGGFILLFLGAGIFDVANGIPLTPLQILWINFAIDVLLAIGLGFDAAAPGLMRRRPRDASAPVVDRPLGIRLGLAGVADGRARARDRRLGRAPIRPRGRDDDGPDDARR